MELTEAQKDAEKTIRIIMFEEVIGTPECEYAYHKLVAWEFGLVVRNI
jgi:hypothetical protein